jgi:hypothetical protein
MPNTKINRDAIRRRLQAFELSDLFIECGWNYPSATAPQAYSVKDLIFSASPIAELSGYRVFEMTSPSGVIPDAATQNAVWKQVARHSAENILIFLNGARSASVWLWMRRDLGTEKGQATKLRPRRHAYRKGHPGDLFISKLSALVVAIDELDEDGNFPITEAANRVAKALDVERLTKKFYNEFDTHRKAFISFIKGITDIGDREWYCSVMLNRLMFVYFIQQKGFLDGDYDYLRNRLSRCKKENGKDQFYSFYRYFLLRLFHEGFGKRKRDRSPDLEKLLGNIPYLNGGLFDVHELERPDRYGKEIQIPDKAFERVFDCFDEYEWVLDPERSVKNPGDKEEINPDVLGYIFEKYINQKQMGAYYTKEDITEYISKGTVLPFLLCSAREKCATAFDPRSGPNVWELLKDNPDSYIYPAVWCGVESKLPPEITVGLDLSKPNLAERRKSWNKTAASEFALPTETWREVVARRQHYDEVRAKLVDGEVQDVGDFLKLNLDLRQFTRDVIQNCEGPDLLMAFWHAITKITILDPTGGSGAFIFAALNLLELLYEDCLDRMEGFLAEWSEDGKKLHPQHHKKFTEVLNRVEEHPNRRYFILKSIILNNLYAVDIMEEAVEICKLRLFLKLASQVEPDPGKDNLGIEPLPDIDFNIRPGNTLVGYATKDEVRRCMKEAGGGQMKLLGDAELGTFDTFNRRCADVEQAFTTFRQRQTEMDGLPPQADKLELQKRLRVLEEELNLHLAGEYGVNVDNPKAYAKWIKVYQPFHWFVQFYGIIAGGGFDVIIGNPPYVVNTPQKVHYALNKELFQTYESKNLYAFVVERSLQLSGPSAAVGMIVQLTALSARKMQPLQDLLMNQGALFASAFPRRPESIFDGVEMPVTILISQRGSQSLNTTRINRFYTEERPNALAKMQYQAHSVRLKNHRIAKFESELDLGIWNKLSAPSGSVDGLTTDNSKYVLYYQEACRYWVKAHMGLPFFRRNGESMEPPHGRTLFFRDAKTCAFAACLVNSSLFYWYYSAFSDCEHINDSLVREFRIPAEIQNANWSVLESELAKSQKRNGKRKTIVTKKEGHEIEYDEMDAFASKPIIDKIDAALAEHYGFTAEENDYLTNYDIKYRAGKVEEDFE